LCKGEEVGGAYKVEVVVESDCLELGVFAKDSEVNGVYCQSKK
jgi:hypothetical protein